MKRTVLFVVFLMLGIGVLKSQGIRFGIIANPEVSWMGADIKSIENSGTRLGFNVGMTMENYFAENYAFVTGISICGQGGKLSYTEDSLVYMVHSDQISIPAGSKVDYKLQYVEIPVGLKFKSNEIGYVTFFAKLGFTGQFNIKARATDSQKNLEDDNISEEINLLNLGYHFGGGIEYSLGANTALVVGITYTNGFLDVTSRSKDKVTLNKVSLHLGVMF